MSLTAVPILPESTVGEILRTFPSATAVFLKRRMHCPGCHMNNFMTLREAAASYSLSVDGLVRDLRTAANMPLESEARSFLEPGTDQKAT